MSLWNQYGGAGNCLWNCAGWCKYFSGAWRPNRVEWHTFVNIHETCDDSVNKHLNEVRYLHEILLTPCQVVYDSLSALCNGVSAL